MPGRKVFVANDILTAADVNEFLANQAVMVFADATARTTAIPSPLEGMVTYLADSDGLFTWSGSAWVPAINTASLVDGNVTTAKLGAGTILQVAGAVLTGVTSTTSSSFVDISGLSVTMTPRSAASRFFVTVTVSGARSSGSNNNGNGLLAIRRNDAVLSPIADAAGSRATGSAPLGSNTSGNTDSVQWVDSPNTTSAVTYKAVFRRAAQGTVFVNRDESDSDSSSNRRYASEITVMEVAG
jgi:hypothetical protein